MTKKLLFVTTLLAAAFTLLAADVSGKWTFEMAGRGGQSRQVTITLKQDGSTLTGSVPGMGRGGQGGQETPITNGKVDGDHVTFEVHREFNGNEFVQKYDGTVSGDEMKLKITSQTPNGEQTREVTAKRATT